MARRSPETLADYLVVAISPALIMLLVGSLVFFLIEVFYQGQYQGRLLFVMAMFVMAIVCVARISIEEGAGYAALFGAPLAIVTAVALARFVEVQGPLAEIGQLVNWGLMALVWWSAHKLTWDCTLIDDSQDASGHGLLQELGFDRPAENSAARAAATPPGTSTAAAEATTGQTADPKSWWQTMFEADRRPHAPGLWVVYFSLAALPLFGVGGWFIPSTADDVRRRAFLFLVVYVASGLTLLLSTSFLGLRRYLRQRQLEMPLEMAASWVGVGLVLIVATLVIAAFLPRPHSLGAFAKLPIEFDSPDRKANRIAAGPEGAQEDPSRKSSSAAPSQEGQKAQREGKGESKEENEKGSQAGKSNEPGRQPEGSAGNSSDGGKTSGEGKSSNQNQSSNQQKSSDQGQPQQNGQKSGEQNRSQDSGKSNATSQDTKGENNNKAKTPPERTQSQSADTNSSKTAQASTSPPSHAEPPPPPPSQPLSNIRISWSGVLAWLLQALFLVAMAIAALVLAWIYRAELLAAWTKLLAELRELWERWFGKKQAAGAVTAPLAEATPPRPFAAFSDPFATGAAARMPWGDLVRYTYQALEAWGREHGCPRAPGQTPHEFAAALAADHAPMARLVRTLADWYGQLAYASRPAAPGTSEPLRELWHAMRTTSTAPALTT